MNTSGVKAVAPGWTRTCSIPASRNSGQSRSSAVTAAISQPSDTAGIDRLAAKASARWPTNMAPLSAIRASVDPGARQLRRGALEAIGEGRQVAGGHAREQV